MAENMFLQKLQAGLFGQPNNYGGMLSEDDLKAARHQAMLAMGAQLMAAGGPSSQPTSLGQALGQGIMAGQQVQQGANESTLQNLLLKSQIEKAQRGNENQPNSVREYEYAKQSGFEGSFQDWIVAGGQSSRPSSVQEWEFYNSLIQEDQKNGTNKAQMYLEMKRNPNFKVAPIAGVENVIAPSIVGGTSTTPLSSLPAEIRAAELRKEAEARASAVGTGRGNIEAGIGKKGEEAVVGGNILDIAEPLIDVATGSATGAARDKVAAWFGKATTGAEAIGKLQVLQAALMMNQPRMEGPQGEKDVELYQKAAGQIGDPTVPGPIKKAAMKTIREIQDRYKTRAAQQSASGQEDPLGIR